MVQYGGANMDNGATNNLNNKVLVFISDLGNEW